MPNRQNYTFFRTIFHSTKFMILFIIFLPSSLLFLRSSSMLYVTFMNTTAIRIFSIFRWHKFATLSQQTASLRFSIFYFHFTFVKRKANTPNARYCNTQMLTTFEFSMYGRQICTLPATERTKANTLDRFSFACINILCQDRSIGTIFR